MNTASKAVTCTSQKASTTDQRGIAVIRHFPKVKRRQENAFSLESQSLHHEVFHYFWQQFRFLAERQGVGVRTPCTCLPTQFPHRFSADLQQKNYNLHARLS